MDIVVQKVALDTLYMFGITKLFFFKSTLLKTIPVFGLEGIILTLDGFPVCRPTPSILKEFLIVFWFNIDTTNLYILCKLIKKQLILQLTTMVII